MEKGHRGQKQNPHAPAGFVSCFLNDKEKDEGHMEAQKESFH